MTRTVFDRYTKRRTPSGTSFRIYPAGRPLTGKWVLMWRTSIMPCPAFWYYDTKEEAREAARRLR